MTQEQIARLLGYTAKAVSKWECGITIPSMETIIKIADIFNVSIDDLFDHCDEVEYYLGIDGGATTTTFALSDSEGNILQTIKLSSSNPFDIGFEAATKILSEGILKITSNIPRRKISLFAGLSGGTSGDMKNRFTAFFSDYKFARAENGSDVDNIIAAGLGKSNVIAVIMGTGSSAIVQKDGAYVLLGGLGYLFDLGGSGYDIGCAGIRAACMAEDGTGEKTLMREYILNERKTKTVRENLDYFYKIGKSGIASYCTIVFKAFDEGDAVAADILKNNMRHVANLIETGRKVLDSNSKVKTILAGGLTNHSDVLLPMIKESLTYPEKFDISVYTGDVVYGALLRAGMPDVRGLSKSG
ncbi:MAG: XRE family transcriptional regulator [Clostridiales bacterium]|jgi:N-acetylglucosamine kinase-like BadF-type ATPase|nr:XRE family transcriptional regulator [Clostridiales bacterium]